MVNRWVAKSIRELVASALVLDQMYERASEEQREAIRDAVASMVHDIATLERRLGMRPVRTKR